MKKIIKKIFCKDLEKLKDENKKLKKENKLLKIQNKSKDELISAISHEFKNPISIIQGYIETILHSNLPPEMERKFLKKIDANTKRLVDLIDRLYLFTKLENNKIQIKKEKIDLREVALKIKESLNDERIEIKGEKEIIGDKNLMEIVLFNLVSNALKYSNKKVIINLGDKIEVIDFGKGIDKKHLDKIKEKFYRISKNDWDNSLGLGLFIVEKILNLHHSTLQIESKRGETKFYFEIPTQI